MRLLLDVLDRQTSMIAPESLATGSSLRTSPSALNPWYVRLYGTDFGRTTWRVVSLEEQVRQSGLYRPWLKQLAGGLETTTEPLPT